VNGPGGNGSHFPPRAGFCVEVSRRRLVGSEAQIANGLQSFQNCGLLAEAKNKTVVLMTSTCLAETQGYSLDACLALIDRLILKGSVDQDCLITGGLYTVFCRAKKMMGDLVGVSPFPREGIRGYDRFGGYICIPLPSFFHGTREAY